MNKIYYSNGELLSKNRLLNFVIGNRGGGKTYNAKVWCIKDFLRNGKTFVWVRRYKTEMKKMSAWTLDFAHEFPNNKIEVKGNRCYVDGVYCGDFVALSTSQREKSTSYPLCNKIIFDEFLIDKGSLRYINGEVELFLELFETVARMRDDVRALFIANAISIVNPYFVYFKIKPNIDKRFTMNKNAVVELYKNEDYIKEKKKTRFGQLISETDYGDYAIDNKFLRDDHSFICKRPEKLIYSLTLAYKGLNFGVWLYLGKRQDSLYIDDIVEESCNRILSITLDDLTENGKFKDYVGLSMYVIQLKSMFNEGKIYFNNMVTKKYFYEVIKLL